MIKHSQIAIPFLLIPFLCVCILTNAQNVINEYSNFECSHSKLINVPFNKFDKTIEINSPQKVNQTVFYENRDQFSFWYKVVVNENGILSCKINPINEKDKYVLYIYQYSKEDFCNKVFYGKIDPIKKSKFLNAKEDKETFELLQSQIKVKKGDAYWLCVLNVSPSNCGHFMKLNHANDSITINSLCVR